MEKKDKRDWKLPYFDGLCPSTIDWARLAAFIDGEGSILINTQKRGGTEACGFYLRVTVANTKVCLMVWLKETFGGTFKDANTEKYYVGKNWKRAYHWGTSAHRAAWILHNCMPLFIIKADQAELGIQLQESMKLYVRGTGKVPVSLHESRKNLKQRLLDLKAKGVNGIPVPSGPIAKVS